MPPEDANLQKSDHEFLNLNEATVIRKRVSAVDALQGMTTPVPDAPAPLSTPPAPTAAAPPPPPPAAAPPPAPPAPASPSLPFADSEPRVSDRLNKLYGQRREAEEHSARLEAMLVEQNRRIDALIASQTSRPSDHPAPYTNQYSSSPTPGTSVDAGQPLSRQDLQAILEQRDRAIFGALSVREQHDLAREEARRDYPEVFSNADLNAAATRIWNEDRYLRSDPHGPYKAAALAYGLLSRKLPSGAASDAQKAAIAGVGISVASGNAAGPSQAQRYEQAMARARATQSDNDFILARKIQLGLA